MSLRVLTNNLEGVLQVLSGDGDVTPFENLLQKRSSYLKSNNAGRIVKEKSNSSVWKWYEMYVPSSESSGGTPPFTCERKLVKDILQLLPCGPNRGLTAASYSATNIENLDGIQFTLSHEVIEVVVERMAALVPSKRGKQQEFRLSDLIMDNVDKLQKCTLTDSITVELSESTSFSNTVKLSRNDNNEIPLFRQDYAGSSDIQSTNIVSENIKDIKVSYSSPSCPTTNHPGLSIRRTLDRGDYHTGVLKTTIYNNGYNDANCQSDASLVTVNVTDFIPSSIINPVLSKVELWLLSETGANERLDIKNVDFQLVVPAVENGDMTLYLSSINIPPVSSLEIRVPYQPKFRNFELYNSDPFRGVDIIPSRAVISPHASVCGTGSTTIYSNSLVFVPPIPDMSMPFNVISLTSTVYVLLTGIVMNSLTKKGHKRLTDAFDKVHRPKKEDTGLKGKLKKLLVKIGLKKTS